MLAELKRSVWNANLDLQKAGLVTLTWGNVSGLDRERGFMVIKPSGVPYESLKPEHMVILDMDGRRVEGKLNPSVDAPTHLVLYRAFKEIAGVMHCHSVYATAFAQACREIPCLGTTHADQAYGPVPITRNLTATEVKGDYVGNTGKVIVERFRRLNPMHVPVVLVAQHGPFAWGRSAGDSVTNAVALENIARMALATLQINPRSRPLPAYLLDKHFLRKHGANAYYGQGK